MGGKFLKAAALASGIALIPSFAFAQQNVQPVVINGGGGSSPITTCPVGTVASGTCSMPVTVTGSSGSADVNIAKVNGQTVNVGTGAAGTGTQRVTTSTDSTIGTVTTVTNPVGIKGADGSTISSASNPVPVSSSPTPSGTAANGITPVASNAASTLLGKSSPGNLYDVYLTATADSWLYVFNSTSAPSNGAVTAGTSSGNYSECIKVSSGTTGSIAYQEIPEVYSVGIYFAISSTACGTLTLATTGFIHGRTK